MLLENKWLTVKIFGVKHPVLDLFNYNPKVNIGPVLEVTWFYIDIYMKIFLMVVKYPIVDLNHNCLK